MTVDRRDRRNYASLSERLILIKRYSDISAARRAANGASSCRAPHVASSYYDSHYNNNNNINNHCPFCSNLARSFTVPSFQTSHA
eukprot:4391758-Pyramimonas_sp.AAC.1